MNVEWFRSDGLGCGEIARRAVAVAFPGESLKWVLGGRKNDRAARAALLLSVVADLVADVGLGKAVGEAWNAARQGLAEAFPDLLLPSESEVATAWLAARPDVVAWLTAEGELSRASDVAEMALGD